ncbi:MAG: hypothetical protein WDW38_006672 [Sanguina aurantia]
MLTQYARLCDMSSGDYAAARTAPLLVQMRVMSGSFSVLEAMLRVGHSDREGCTVTAGVSLYLERHFCRLLTWMPVLASEAGETDLLLLVSLAGTLFKLVRRHSNLKGLLTFAPALMESVKPTCDLETRLSFILHLARKHLGLRVTRPAPGSEAAEAAEEAAAAAPSRPSLASTPCIKKAVVGPSALHPGSAREGVRPG